MRIAAGGLTVRENLYEAPFLPSSPPVEIEAGMVEINWGYAPGQTGVCREMPESRRPLGKPVKKILIPYGCTVLRMTEMPLAEKTNKEKCF